MYKYKKLEGVDYPLFLFKTITGSEYRISFANYDVINNIQIHSIAVDCVNPKVKDLKTGETINAVISDYLSENPYTILTYVCDSQDNRARHRQRKFIGWYEIYAKESKFVLKAFEIPIPDYHMTYYTALIFNNETYSSDFIDGFYRDGINVYADK